MNSKSPIVINVPTRALLAGEKKGFFDPWYGTFEYQKKFDVNVCKQNNTIEVNIRTHI